MKLHEYKDEFRELISIVAHAKHLPEAAIERDYYIVMLLKRLADSEYAAQCVFKGGTSLSKCYPGSIERFSEDIHLTYLGEPDMSDKAYSKNIRRIEEVMSAGANVEKINSERSNRSKSMYIWFGDRSNQVKLEIGSSVRPDPYTLKTLKSYIHEFLEEHDGEDDIDRYALSSVTLNVLNIERTFLDKVMSVKRHTICGSIESKVRHIYDVTRLFDLPEIKAFLTNADELKRLIQLTKSTDSYYLSKRDLSVEYDPMEKYDFEKWRSLLSGRVRRVYENLHESLLYTDERQDFERALAVFEEIDAVMKNIDE